jgi:hypothetical protein
MLETSVLATTFTGFREISLGLLARVRSIPDISCSDLRGQEIAQRIYSQDMNDPFGLDVDKDGVACEGFTVPPSGSQIVFYVAIAVLLAIALGSIFAIRTKRSVAKGVTDLDASFAGLGSNLDSAARLLSEIEDEMKARKTTVEGLKVDAEKAEALLKLSKKEVRAVAMTLKDELIGSEHRASRGAWRLAVVFCVIGIIASIFVNIFVP